MEVRGGFSSMYYSRSGREPEGSRLPRCWLLRDLFFEFLFMAIELAWGVTATRCWLAGVISQSFHSRSGRELFVIMLQLLLLIERADVYEGQWLDYMPGIPQ
ncbi:unnamed protein product [Prorocentrum cordatum]|uniref:Uncharacterized protein n=1 Tax=Prorocentrum cordatum TaxID=2364126 RepID=A0ABN9U9I6_9DINO|nr:unnamed protein product [Polarella glacialis]